MADLGYLALIFAFGFSAYALVSCALGFWQKREELIVSGVRAFLCSSGWICLAGALVVILLSRDDFNQCYVWGYSNRALPWYFKITALWGGQAGSLLFWNLILNGYAAIALWQNYRRDRWILACIAMVFAASVLFFTLLHLFVANPFAQFHILTPQGEQLFTPPDGKGLNPLLQHPAMVIHPPMLYLGYVGFVVPFAFAIAALATGQLGNRWIKTVRRWTLTAWLFQAIGIMLGARWAYVELGWGGYWAWDPVENASLMPWICGTAFLHSVMVQERQGMLKTWNMVLVILCYVLCIFGTFLTRSGVVSSVHSFAQSSIGTYFLTFIGLILAVSIALLVLRWKELRTSPPLESVISRESSFLFNNLILLCACFSVLWGTIFPVLSEALTGEKIVVGAPFFNKVNIPIALVLLLLTGAGPYFAWRKTSLGTLKKNLLKPALSGLVIMAVLWFVGAHHFYAWICFGLAAFVIHTIVYEFWKGARARNSVTKEGFWRAMWAMSRRNKRRYGGFLVHLGMVLIFVGIAGESFKQEGRAELSAGQTTSFGKYKLELVKINNEENSNYSGNEAVINVTRNGGKSISLLRPEKRYYKSSEQPTSEVALRSSIREDLYVVLADVQENGKALLQLYINPLVNWVWMGGIVLILGTLFAMGPEAMEKK